LKSRLKGIAPIKASAYNDRFIVHVHQLVWEGFSRIDRTNIATQHEPAISGLICLGVWAVLDDPASPAWVTDYEIHDDPPVHDPKRRGKHRRRVDIKLASRRFRPRARFCFEAKALNANAGVADYLGDDGLGQFVHGGYAADQNQGGMLGYVQTEDCDRWSKKVSEKLDPVKQQIGRGGSWTNVRITKQLAHTSQTIHKRPGQLRNIAIIHTLLDCTN